jgi:glycosyltransferase involved in cell wall biosynthesis
MLSYIVPCYNEAPTIALCLQSIQKTIAETEQPSEIIVVDCGSHDGSLDIIQSYPVRLAHIPEDARRYSKAVNLGVSMALGAYIQIVDSDCALAQGWMHQALPFLGRHPALAGVAGIWTGNPRGSALARQRVERATSSRSLLFQSLGGPHLFVRDIIQDYPMDETLKGSEDVDQIVRLKGDGYQTARLRIHMLTQLKPEEAAFSRMISKSFVQHGIGSGQGYRKAWRRSIRCLMWYHYAKKYHLFFSATLLVLAGSLLSLCTGDFVLALNLFVLVIGLYAVTAVAAYALNKSWKGALQLVFLKVVSAAGFCWGLLQKTPRDAPLEERTARRP